MILKEYVEDTYDSFIQTIYLLAFRTYIHGLDSHGYLLSSYSKVC